MNMNTLKKVIFNLLILNGLSFVVGLLLNTYFNIDITIKSSMFIYLFTFVILTSDLIKIMLFVNFQFIRYFNYNVKSGIIGTNDYILKQMYDSDEYGKLNRNLKSLEVE